MKEIIKGILGTRGMKIVIGLVLMIGIICVVCGQSVSAATVSTYNYSTGVGVDKWAYYKEGEIPDGLDSPPTGPPLTGSYIDGEIEITDFMAFRKLADSDNKRYATEIVNNQKAFQHFVFTMGEAIEEITNLHVEWEGGSDEEHESNLYIWNWDSGGWEHVGQGTPHAEEVISKDFTSNYHHYIDTAGNLHLVATSYREDINRKRLFTDYVAVEITFSSTEAPPISNPRPENNSIVSGGSKPLTFGVSTSKSAECRYSDSQGMSFSQMDPFSESDGWIHSSAYEGLLEDGGSYDYYIKARDSYGNINLEDYHLHFEVANNRWWDGKFTWDNYWGEGWTGVASFDNTMVNDGTVNLAQYGASSGSPAIDRWGATKKACTLINVNPDEAIQEDGVITQWQIFVNGQGFVKLKVFRDNGEGYTFVDESHVKTVYPGLNTFTANIPVQQGDFLGVAVDNNVKLDYALKGGSVKYKFKIDVINDTEYVYWKSSKATVSLQATVTSYHQSGTLTSIEITPTSLADWDKVIINGGLWEILHEIPEAESITCLKEYNNKLYVSTSPDGKIYEYDGLEWKESFDVPVETIYDFEVFDGKLYVGCGDYGVQSSARVFQFDGLNWIELPALRECRVDTLEVFNNELYVGTGWGSKDRFPQSEYGNCAIYKWNGSGWERKFYDEELCAVYVLKVYDNKLWAGTGCMGKIFYSSTGNEGDWRLSIDTNENSMGYDLEVFKDKLYVGTGRFETGKIHVYDGSDWSIDWDIGCRVGALQTFKDKLYLGCKCSDLTGYAYGRIYRKDEDGWHFEMDTYDEAIVDFEVFNDSLLAPTAFICKNYYPPKAAGNHPKIFILDESPDWTFKLLDSDYQVIPGYEDLEAIGWDISALPTSYDSIRLSMSSITSDPRYSFNLHDWSVSWITKDNN